MTTATFVTNKGSFTVTLMPEHAPKTVANFVDLATGGREWTTATARSARSAVPRHDLPPGDRRVHDPGRRPEGTGMGGPGYTFEDEVPADGPTFNQVGRLAMANAGPGTNGSQFFVTVGETPWLNGKHTIFGQVTDGYDVVEAIAKTAGGAQDKPVDDVVIERIDIAE